MAHLPALPGTPLYDEHRGPDAIVVADVIAGSDLEVDGGTWNAVDAGRAEDFMSEIRQAR
jgi:predicted TIM-barrel enzyme